MKKSSLTILILALVAVAGLAFWFFVRDNNTGGADGSSRSFLSFFGISGDRESDTPRGTSDGAEVPPGTQDGPGSGADGIFVPPLRRVWEEPAAAPRFVTREDGREAVRFIDRATGHVFDALATSTEVLRLTNTTIPAIQEALWIDDTRLVIRYLRNADDVIETFAAEILPPPDTATSTEGAVGSLGGFFLPAGITALAVSPETGDIFYLTETSSGSEGFITPAVAHQPERVFTSPAREWTPRWYSAGTILLATKPSAGVHGFAYALSVSAGSLEKLLGGLAGLTVEPLYAQRVLLYSANAPAPQTHLYDIKSETPRRAPFDTLPEKCLTEGVPLFCAVPGSVGSGLPDSWYQGLVFFSDTVRTLNVSQNTSEVFFNPREFTNEAFDIISLSANTAGERIAFINKRDGTLWLYQQETTTLPEGN